jgi:hypothetical protein
MYTEKESVALEEDEQHGLKLPPKLYLKGK